MRQLTPEQIGLDYRALLDLIGEERLIDLIGAKRLIDLIGEERVVDLMDEDRLMAVLRRRKGTQWLRTALERYAQQADTPGEPPAPAAPEN